MKNITSDNRLRIPLFVYLLYMILLSSLIAQLVSLKCNATVANVAILVPLIPLAMPSFTKIPIPRQDTWCWICLCLWAIGVLVFQASWNTRSLVRLLAYLFYVFFYFLCCRVFRWNYLVLRNVWTYLFIIIILLLLASNIVKPDIGFTPYYISSIRYDGLFGCNYHGIISIIGLISSVAVLVSSRSVRKRIFLALSFFYCLANAWATGSRASMLVLLVFTFVYFILRLEQRKKRWFFVICFGLLAYGFGTLVEDNALLKTAFRLNEFSLQGRLLPVIWGVQQITNNYGLPYGLGVMNDVAYENHLDSSFLMIGIELGVVAILLIGFFVATTIKSAIRVLGTFRDFNVSMLPLVQVSVASFIALLVHGAFETFILSSFEIGTLLLLLVAAFFNTVRFSLQKRATAIMSNAKQNTVDNATTA